MPPFIIKGVRVILHPLGHICWPKPTSLARRNPQARKEAHLWFSQIPSRGLWRLRWQRTRPPIDPELATRKKTTDCIVCIVNPRVKTLPNILPQIVKILSLTCINMFWVFHIRWCSRNSYVLFSSHPTIHVIFWLMQDSLWGSVRPVDGSHAWLALGHPSLYSRSGNTLW